MIALFESKISVSVFINIWVIAWMFVKSFSAKLSLIMFGITPTPYHRLSSRTSLLKVMEVFFFFRQLARYNGNNSFFATSFEVMWD